MKRIRKDRRGQVTLYDAILFFIIITIASTMLIVAVTRSSGIEEIKEDKDIVDYTGGAFSAVTHSTMYRVSYRETGGDEVVLYNMSIPYLILFDLMARERGAADTGSLEDGVEDKIGEIIDRLVDDRYYFIFRVDYNGTTAMEFRDHRLPPKFEPEEFVNTEKKFGMAPYLSNDALMRLMIWRM